MVPDPEQFDDDNDLIELSPDEKESFDDLFEDCYRSIDEERVKQDLKNQINQGERERVESAESLVGGFHPRRRSQDTSGFEFEFLSPLCELGIDGGDLLIARADYNGLHLCVVTCEVGGENPQEWIRRVNRVCENVSRDEIRERLKAQLQSSEKTVQSVQYITLAREVDLQEFNYSNIGHSVEANNHCVWERDRDNKEFRHRGGNLAHQDLTGAIEQGFDYGSIGAPTIQYLIGSHPILALEEVGFKLIYDHRSEDNDHPQEFNRNEFRHRYESLLELGAEGEEYDQVVSDEVSRILQFGIDINFIEDDPDEIDSTRDFDFKFSGEKPTMAKRAVMSKYLKKQTSLERGRRAFDIAQDQFDHIDSDLDRYMD